MSFPNFEEPEKYDNSISQNGADSDLASLINGKIQLKLRRHKPKIKPLSTMEFSSLKNTSTAFFILFLITVSIVSFTSCPTILYKKMQSIKPSEKFRLHNLSYYFSIQTNSMKSVMIATQIIFLFLCGCLYNLQKQRMSVPEYQNKKYLTTMFLVLSSLSSILFLTNLFFYEPINSICESNGYGDSFLFFAFILSCLGTCLVSNMILSLLVDNEEYDSYISFVMHFKKISIILMTTNFGIYMLALILMKITGGIENEFTSPTLINISIINLILFLVNFSLFVFSLRVDIDFIYSLLNIQPDVEYFVDDHSSINENDDFDEEV